LICRKNRYDGFCGTWLEHFLSHVWRVHDLIIVGTVSNICVLHTAASAGLRNLQVVVPAGGIALNRRSLTLQGDLVRHVNELYNRPKEGRMKTEDVARILSHSALFGNLDLQGQEEMAQQMRMRTYRAGELIVLAGDPCHAVYLIVKGKVHIERLSSGGREYVLHIMHPGQGFNLTAAMDGGGTVDTASALTDTVACVIPVDVFRQLVRDYPQVALAVLGHLTSRVRQLCSMIEDLAFYTVRTRLARCLLSRADGEADVARYTSQTELALRIGTVRTVIGRTLRSFSQLGLIRRERGRVVITDREGLQREALCGPEALGQSLVPLGFELSKA
jgi:CRP/FNR family transcriptional regulator